MKNIQSPILRGLLNSKKNSQYRFHMPGHKGKLPKEYQSLADNLFSLDFTEINGTDDLYNASGFLKEGLDLLAEDRKSKQSFYLTNGTTVGILASILALTNKNESILIASECHKSVYNAIELNDLKAIILENNSTKSGLISPLIEDDIIKKLKENSCVKMVVLTRPNYYGLCCDIEKLSKYCFENKIYLLIDEAHGSHFVYHKDLPKSAMELGAQISVNSFHKTLPSFTQSSVLNLNENLSDYDCSKVLNMVEKLQTSSPSYLLMASIDISRAYMNENGQEKLDELKYNITNFYKSISDIDWIKIVDNNQGYEKEFTRIVLETKMPATNVQEYLEKNNIYIEMISLNLLVLIATTEDTKDDLKFLSKILHKFKFENNKSHKDKFLFESSIVDFHDGKLVPLSKSAGKTLKENIIIYPPGSVYLQAGNVIQQKDVDYISYLLNSGINVYTDFNKDINLIYVSID